MYDSLRWLLHLLLLFEQSYEKPDHIIATQFPLTNTVSDFWLAMEQHEVKIIVLLSNDEIAVSFLFLFSDNKLFSVTIFDLLHD